MLAGLIIDPALRVATVIAGIAIASPFTRERLEQGFALGQLTQPKIEEPGSVTIDQNDPQLRKCSQKSSQGLQMEVTIDEELRTTFVLREQGWNKIRK